MFMLVISRTGSLEAPLVYGPFDTIEEAAREWDNQKDIRSLFGDMLRHHIVPLATRGVDRTTPPLVVQPLAWPPPYWGPYWYWTQPVRHDRVTWVVNQT